ncbi:MAG: rhomboid family intramembrane serine protease [Desulfovibrionaceae bacterium]|nr:rhomboid family intramembrane serine protease [Desulfovibrionaceae bacterium]
MPMMSRGRTFSLKIAGKRWRCRLLPRRIPPFWMPLFPPSQPLQGRRLHTWPYVLQALRIPYRLFRGWEPLICVPVLLEKKARRNLYEYDEEEIAPKRTGHLPDERPLAWLASLIIVPIILVYALQNWAPLHTLAPALGFPAEAADWSELLGADNVRMRLFHEWSRAVTALFLHADIAHLVANAAFTFIFARLLGAWTGFGLAFFLIVWAGALGNVVCAVVRQGFVLSIGFSTALFAAVGALSGFVSLFSRPKAMLPLAAGAAILAMLGTEGENTDYLAHVCGLVCGMLAGLGAAAASVRKPSLMRLPWQLLFLLLSAALPLFCFWLRLHR